MTTKNNYLTQAQIDYRMELVRRAARHGKVDLVQTLLSENPWLVRYLNSSDWFLLYFTNDYETAKVLLEHGVSVNSRDPRGYTVFHQFCLYRDNRLISLYLRYGADPYRKDHIGRTALEYIEEGLLPDYKEDARKQWRWIQSVPVLVTLVAINERRRLGGGTALQTELFRYLQVFLTTAPRWQ